MLKIVSKSKLELEAAVLDTLKATVIARDRELAEMRLRVRALEDAHEKSTGIKVRVDNAVVIAKFTKAEMCVMQGALYAYARAAKNLEDTKYAMALYEKMEPMLAGMKE